MAPRLARISWPSSGVSASWLDCETSWPWALSARCTPCPASCRSRPMMLSCICYLSGCQGGTAVDDDVLQGDVASQVRGEEQHGVGHLLGRGDLLQRDAELELLGEAGNGPRPAAVVGPHAALHGGIGGTR